MAIKISKNRLDMDSKPIKNSGRIDATEIHGIVYYTDVHFEEKECAVCGARFKPGDGIALYVRRVTAKGTDLIPAHIDCFCCETKKGQSKKKIKKR
ncbi:MAG: hypothetical protein WC565_01565 [Parcubacteria group bacterium]